MKRYTLMNGENIAKDEDGHDVSYVATIDENVIVWMYQKKGELNNFRKGPYWIKVSDAR